eukprot:2463599-Rhodomonas_salina.1
MCIRDRYISPEVSVARNQRRLAAFAVQRVPGTRGRGSATGRQTDRQTRTQAAHAICGTDGAILLGYLLRLHYAMSGTDLVRISLPGGRGAVPLELRQ